MKKIGHGLFFAVIIVASCVQLSSAPRPLPADVDTDQRFFCLASKVIGEYAAKQKDGPQKDDLTRASKVLAAECATLYIAATFTPPPTPTPGPTGTTGAP